MSKTPPDFEAWKKNVHPSIRNDPLWKFHVYPKTLYVYDLTWDDCKFLLKDVRGKKIAEQLIRSAGSISANIEEGYGRGFGNDYAYRLRIAIGEARETRGWYWRGRELLPDEVLNHRLKLLSDIIAMLAPNVQKQRDYKQKK